MRLETCVQCYEPTGRAGRSDDSIYCELLTDYEGQEIGDEIGPLCVACYRRLRELGIVDCD
jgi:hypothetical protein